MILSDAVIDKLRSMFQIWIVVLSIAFKIAEFHGFPLHPLGLVTFEYSDFVLFSHKINKCKVSKQGIVVLHHRLYITSAMLSIFVQAGAILLAVVDVSHALC